MFRTLTTEDKITKARLKLLIDYPFFGYLAIGLELQEHNDMDPATMATDGNNLFYNSAFVEGLSPDHLKSVLAHEALHCALGHIWRIGTREPKKWNYATDYAINLILEENNLELPPIGCLYDLRYKNMTADKIYTLLPDPRTIKGGLINSHEMWPGSKKEPRTVNPPDQKMKEKWSNRLAQAAHIARTGGKLPGLLENMISDILQPKLDWKTILRNLVMSTAKNDFRLFPPAKKYIWQGIYLPSVHGEMIEIAVGVDTSGSVSIEEFQEFLAEIRGITEQFSDYLIHLFFCDHDLHRYSAITPQESWPKSFPKKDGGTSFIPVFNEVAKKDLPISVLVYLTDGAGSFPDSEPEYPVIWLLNKEATVPWGTKVIID